MSEKKQLVNKDNIEEAVNGLLDVTEGIITALAEMEDRIRFLEAAIGEDMTDMPDGSPHDLQMVSDQ